MPKVIKPSNPMNIFWVSVPLFNILRRHNFGIGKFLYPIPETKK